ncbi:hypothetical protein ACIHFD_57310 [Nonomuraea sp. NPDC051941]|uniref:hypothetical protein n=1 Tax=Nonomuraea sp. NPDC051941 TaxID=3364373 RepID=UPI0037CBFF69
MYSEIGKRVTIADAFHSHWQTRAYKDQLVGREGVIVAVLRDGNVALVELAEDGLPFPAGVRRWSFRWDDLHVESAATGPDRLAIKYRAGFTWKRRQAVQHAVPSGKEIALCGKNARPLPICGWSLTFSPTVDRACPICVQLAEAAAQRGDTGDVLAS